MPLKYIWEEIQRGWVLIFPRISLQRRSPSSASVSAGHPCASHSAPSLAQRLLCCAHRESQGEHFWLKALKPKVQTAQWVQIHHLQRGCLWSARWALQGGHCCLFFGRGSLSYLNAFAVVRSWFCSLSLWQLQEKLQDHDQHSRSAFPAEELFWKVCELNMSL